MTPTKRVELPVHELSYGESPDLVYFPSIPENTRRLVDKLDRLAVRIPLRPRLEGRLRVNRPYVLIVPSYEGGDKTQAIPKQVATLLNDPHDRALLRGIITSGNTNFGGYYCIAGPIIVVRHHVPGFYRFELFDSDCDVKRVNIGLQHFWAEIEVDDTSNAPPMNLRRRIPANVPPSTNLRR